MYSRYLLLNSCSSSSPLSISAEGPVDYFILLSFAINQAVTKDELVQAEGPSQVLHSSSRL